MKKMVSLALALAMTCSMTAMAAPSPEKKVEAQKVLIRVDLDWLNFEVLDQEELEALGLDSEKLASIDEELKDMKILEAMNVTWSDEKHIAWEDDELHSKKIEEIVIDFDVPGIKKDENVKVILLPEDKEEWELQETVEVKDDEVAVSLTGTGTVVFLVEE